MERLQLPEFFEEIQELVVRVELVSDALDSKQSVSADGIDLEVSIRWISDANEPINDTQ